MRRTLERKNSAPVKMRQGFVTGDGMDIYYKTLGRGIPLLLLHGGPGADHSDFLPALKPLSRHCQLVLIDERGSGRSGRLRDPKGYTLELMIRDIERVRRHLKLQRLVLFGHSFGGILAQAYAVHHSHRLLGLVLAGTASSARRVDADFRRIRKLLPVRLQTKLSRLEKAGIFNTEGQYEPNYAAASARALSPYMFAKPPPSRFTKPSSLGMDVLREMWVRRSDFYIDGNLKGFDFTRALKRVSVPSLVVIGDRDLVSTTTSELTRAALPRATMVVMAECAHMMFIDQTAAFNRLMVSFLTLCSQELKGRAA